VEQTGICDERIARPYSREGDRRLLSAQPGPSLGALAVVREDSGPSSDVDLLVAFEPGARIGLLALGRMQRELSTLLGRPVDLYRWRGSSPRCARRCCPAPRC
jgi:hypothetical protein